MRSEQAKTALSTWVMCAIACGIGAYFLVDSAPGAIGVVFYSMLSPLFFVVSGIAIDWHTVADNPVKVLGLPALILVTRRLPVYLREVFRNTGSGITNPRERLKVGI